MLIHSKGDSVVFREGVPRGNTALAALLRLKGFKGYREHKVSIVGLVTVLALPEDHSGRRPAPLFSRLD